MRRLKQNLFSFLLFMLCAITNGQSIAIGQWREHLPYKSVICLADAGHIVYAATPYSLFAYDKTDNSIRRINKTNGLSDHGISTINYHKAYNALFVAYENTNIDVLINNQVHNVPDIKNKVIGGRKQINRIRFLGAYAYLCSSFGVSQFDLVKMEIKDTYTISSNGDAIDVYDFTSDGSYFYAATSDGVYRASHNSINLSDFQSWEKLIHNSSNLSHFNSLAYFNGNIYANKHTPKQFNKDTIMYFANGNWQLFDSTETTTVNAIEVSNNKLVVTYNFFVFVYDTAHEIVRKVWTYNPGEVVPLHAFMDSDEIIWIADIFEGLVRNFNEWGSEFIVPNGPADASSYAMDFAGGKLWVSTGGMDVSWNNLFSTKGVYSFQDNQWFSFTGKEIPAMDSLYDILSVAINPNNSDKVYFGTWGKGLFEFSGNQLTQIFDNTNSSLQSIQGFVGYSWIGVYGITFDADGNLWVVNASAPNILSVRKTDGSWRSFGFGFANSNIRAGSLVIDKANQKWIVLPRGQGLLVFNDGGTIDNTGDDKYKRLTNLEGNGKLPSMNISSIAVDLDGKIWVGTDKGIAVFYAPENVFTNYSFDAEQILVEREGIAQYLFETEIITDIKIDGGNRKWISTLNAGVFLISANGMEEIFHFNKDNSPLFSNNVLCVAIDGESGEVFFGTDKGIISYRSTATTGKKVFEKVVVFPNPVRENYTGPIAIKGLVTNVDIKITDVSGNLVYITRAEGGQAIWDGRNTHGNRVKTGVYLIFCSDEDGKNTHVAKVLFIN